MPPRRVKIKGLPASRPSAISPLPRSASLTATSAPVVSAFLGALGRYRRLLLVLLLLALSNIAGYYYPVLWSPARRATLLATRATLSHWWANASHPSQALQALPSLGKEAGYELRRIIASGEEPGEARRAGGRGGGGAATPSPAFSPLPPRPPLAGLPRPPRPGQQPTLPRLSPVSPPTARPPLPPLHTAASPSPAWPISPALPSARSSSSPCHSLGNSLLSQPITRLAHLSRPSLRLLVFLARHGLGNSLRGFVSAFVFARLSGRHLVTLHAGEHHKVSQPITRLAHLSRPALRSLVFLARHGLGNSLRGFVSAFVFARLAGRRLVTLHAGEHHKVYDLLCHAFHCGFDGVRWGGLGGGGGGGEAGKDGEGDGGGDGGRGGGRGGNGTEGGGGYAAGEGGMLLPMELYRRFNELQPKYLMESIKSIPAMRNAIASTHPILGARTGSHFDLFWHRNDTLRSCVYAAFKC
ncbi:unnamed protein product, partial [Closterium sp. Naga37s-1]